MARQELPPPGGLETAAEMGSTVMPLVQMELLAAGAPWRDGLQDHRGARRHMILWGPVGHEVLGRQLGDFQAKDRALERVRMERVLMPQGHCECWGAMEGRRVDSPGQRKLLPQGAQATSALCLELGGG